jgi:hypothetical protein
MAEHGSDLDKRPRGLRLRLQALLSTNTTVRLTNWVKGLAFRAGYDVSAISPYDLQPRHREIFVRVRPHTMTSLARIHAVISAAEHVVRRSIPGAFVECGVWRGGSSMAALLAFQAVGDTEREAWLYDTYEGMTPPGERDGAAEAAIFDRLAPSATGSAWCRAGLDVVERNIASCGYPMAKVHLVAGRVEETIPANAPDEIAVLRLDTDWYESTRHTLEHLYPRLVSGGVLIIDDYGAWEGCQRAVDEYLAAHGIGAFLHRLDSTGRLLIKP